MHTFVVISPRCLWEQILTKWSLLSQLYLSNSFRYYFLYASITIRQFEHANINVGLIECMSAQFQYSRIINGLMAIDSFPKFAQSTKVFRCKAAIPCCIKNSTQSIANQKKKSKYVSENPNFLPELKVLAALQCACGLLGWRHFPIKVKNWFRLDPNCHSIKRCILKMFHGFSVKGVLPSIFYHIHELDVFVLSFTKI